MFIRNLLPSLMLSAFLLIAAGAARADLELSLGTVDEIDGVRSEAVALNYLTDEDGPWEFMLAHISERNRPVTVSTPDVVVLAASRRFTWRNWLAQAGVAWTDSDTDVLSGHWQFMTGMGYRWDRWTLSLRHLSNANTAGRNRGENLLMLQYRFR